MSDLLNGEDSMLDHFLWCYSLGLWKLVGHYGILITSKEGEFILSIKYLKSALFIVWS